MKYAFRFCLIISLLLLSACDSNKIPPGSTAENSGKIPDPQHTGIVETKEINQVYEAVGTIRPLTESVIEAQINAQIISVSCKPGKTVKKGQLLIQLDERQLAARLEQAREGLAVAKKNLTQTQKSINEAKAALDQARSTFERTQKLFKSDIVPSQKLDIDKASFLQAKARLEKTQEAEHSARSSIRGAEEVVKEARIALGYARITSPADGIVAERMADPGDIAVPGKPLLIIQTSGALRLEANVREGLIARVLPQNSYQVRIETLRETITSTIDEIVPYADPVTRTFLVKASLPATTGVYPGMFGRLLIPVEQESTLLIPKKAVQLVGQLELVLVKKQDSWQKVYIKTGRSFDDKIEVLAGLSGNEIIGYSD